MMNDFQTIKNECFSELKEKGSKFIGIAIPIGSEDEFKIELKKIKAKYEDAGHHCYGFKIDHPNQLERYSDDGEPSGTAGAPIFGQILSLGLTNVMVVVIRYFGGTKLGTSGLIKTYKTCARLALENAEIITKTLTKKLIIEFNYNQTVLVKKIANEFGLNATKETFEDVCRAEFEVPLNQLDGISDRLSNTQLKLLNSNEL